MRHLLPIVTATLLFVAAPAVSQVSSTSPAPGMGMTSPLGGAGPVGPVGIPLGSTELTPGGLSPGPLGATAGISNCGTNGTSVTGGITPGISGSGTTGASSTFDGGGNVGMSAPCSSTLSGSTVSGTQNPFVTGTTGGSALGVGTIPLGSTELASPGISPIVPSPGAAPGLTSASPCVGTSMTSPGTLGGGSTIGTSSMSSPTVC
jgi:hypothetical protein